MSDPAHPLPEKVLAALRRGQPIEAVKLLRESGGIGLKEAVEAIDAQRQRKAAPPAHSAPPIVPARKRAEASRLSPGEVPRSGGIVWWIAAGAAAWLAYRAFFPRLD